MRLDKAKLYYLATPISGNEAEVAWRFYQNADALATLTTAGYLVYAPCCHWYTTVRRSHLPNSWSYWKPRSLRMLIKCDAIIVLQLPGWERSTGVLDELRHAQRWRMPKYGMTHAMDLEVHVLDYISVY